MKTPPIILLIFACLAANAQPEPLPETNFKDTLHGKIVDDPFRYMENLQDTTVTNWIKKHNEYAEREMFGTKEKDWFFNKIKSYESMSNAFKWSFKVENNTLYYVMYTKGDNAPKLYAQKTYKDALELIFDPSSYYKTDAERQYIGYFTPSISGKYIYISLTKDRQYFKGKIWDVEKKVFLKDSISNERHGAISWWPNDMGFSYLCYKTTDPSSPDLRKGLASKLHTLNSQEQDDIVLLSEEVNPVIDSKGVFPIVIYDKVGDKIIGQNAGPGVLLPIMYYCEVPLDFKKPLLWKTIKPKDKQSELAFIADNLYYLNFSEAGESSIYHCDLKSGKQTEITALANEGILTFKVIKANLLCFTTQGGVGNGFYMAKKEGNKWNTKKIELPLEGTVQFQMGMNNHLFVEISSWTKTQCFEFNTTTFKFTLIEALEIKYPDSFKNIAFKTVMVESHDKTKIPLSIIYPTSRKIGKNTPLLLSGYGAHGMSEQPQLNNNNMAWCEAGGIIAFAHVRGGGEFGEKWHLAGVKSKKENTWKDFIACAEWLKTNNYTSMDKLICYGKSMGGLCIGNAIAEKPDLCKVAIIEVGISNPLRMENSPNYSATLIEAGTVKDSTDYPYMLKMDPYQKIKRGVTYPVMLITAAWNDDRVIYWQPAKLAAKIQSYSPATKLYFQTHNYGHFYDEPAKYYPFMIKQVGVDLPTF